MYTNSKELIDQSIQELKTVAKYIEKNDTEQLKYFLSVNNIPVDTFKLQYLLNKYKESILSLISDASHILKTQPTQRFAKNLLYILAQENQITTNESIKFVKENTLAHLLSYGSIVLFLFFLYFAFKENELKNHIKYYLVLAVVSTNIVMWLKLNQIKNKWTPFFSIAGPLGIFTVGIILSFIFVEKLSVKNAVLKFTSILKRNKLLLILLGSSVALSTASALAFKFYKKEEKEKVVQQVQQIEKDHSIEEPDKEDRYQNVLIQPSQRTQSDKPVFQLYKSISNTISDAQESISSHLTQFKNDIQDKNKFEKVDNIDVIKEKLLLLKTKTLSRVKNELTEIIKNTHELPKGERKKFIKQLPNLLSFRYTPRSYTSRYLEPSEIFTYVNAETETLQKMFLYLKTNVLDFLETKIENVEQIG